VQVVGDLGDFSPAEVFVPAVIVQGQHAGQTPLSRSGLEKHGFGRRAVGQLPTEMLDVQSVIHELMLHLRLRHSPGVGRQQALRQARLGQTTPGVEIAGGESWIQK
jgi:hypothetical protein